MARHSNTTKDRPKASHHEDSNKPGFGVETEVVPAIVEMPLSRVLKWNL